MSQVPSTKQPSESPKTQTSPSIMPVEEYQKFFNEHYRNSEGSIAIEREELSLIGLVLIQYLNNLAVLKRRLEKGESPQQLDEYATCLILEIHNLKTLLSQTSQPSQEHA